MTAETTAKRKEKSRITAQDVDTYLRRHPEFFKQRLELLEILKIPHPCGGAVSLVTRQIQVLRDRDHRLQRQVNEILEVARDNDILRERIHRLTLTLLDANSLEDALAGLRWGLHEYFQADFVSVRIAHPIIDTPIADLAIPLQSESLYSPTLEAGEPRCLSLLPREGVDLFGGGGAEASSCAFVPLQHAGLRGVLAIGSRDPDRFQPGMGSLFLAQMGEIVSARLAALIGKPG